MMLVHWKKDGEPVLLRVLSAADAAVAELERGADMLHEVRAALEDHADLIEWRDEGTANNLRRLGDRCNERELAARAAIARAVGLPA